MIANEDHIATMSVVADNAKAFLCDAELLYSHQRWARAASLAVLSIEEVGKYFQHKHGAQLSSFSPGSF